VRSALRQAAAASARARQVDRLAEGGRAELADWEQRGRRAALIDAARHHQQDPACSSPPHSLGSVSMSR
jgi:hypothetical protein